MPFIEGVFIFSSLIFRRKKQDFIYSGAGDCTIRLERRRAERKGGVTGRAAYRQEMGLEFILREGEAE